MSTFFDNVLTNNPYFPLAPAGFIVLIVHVGLTLLYFSISWLIKSWRKWRGMTPTSAGALRLAAAQGNIKHLDILSTAYNFQVDAAVEGFTALHAAAVEGQHRSLAWLLEKGADVNKQKNDKWHDTVLHYAAASGSLECCKLLVSRGVDVRAKNFAGLTPRDYAFANNHAAVVQYLDDLSRQLKQGGSVPTAEDMDTKQEPPEKLREGDVFLNAQAIKDATAPMERQYSSAEAQVRIKHERKRLCARGFDGLNTPGTKPTRLMKLFRTSGVFSIFFGAVYLLWRATRSLTPGPWLAYSIPMFTVEWFGFLGWIWSVIGLWSTIDRPPRVMSTMLPEKDFPSVDVYVVAYTEPVSVVESTVIAAMNLNWPGSKLTVYVLDDGKNQALKNLCMKLDFQCQYGNKSAKICYICREKVGGVPHHAKAGNINHTLLKGGVARGEYILVLDSDMIVSPDFLQRSMGHLYHQNDKLEWKQKPKAGFIQIPQDFWNVSRSDPMFHLNTFFFGPMLKGRDGVGAVSCAGTGVIFKRDVLVSIGGQSYGSITEDFNTSMHLLMSGFSTMYLHEALVFGDAPEDVPATFIQRLRWAQGAIQVYMRNNPIRIGGLSNTQSILFYDACFSHFTAPLIIFVALVPVLYLYFDISPLVIPEGRVWEFVLFFLLFYMTNRLTLLIAFVDSRTGMHAAWRTAQQAVWLSVNHAKAVWKVLRTELPIIKHLAKAELGFVVTKKKDKAAEAADAKPGWWKTFKATLYYVWPFVLFYLITLGALIKVIVFWIRGTDIREVFAQIGALLWTAITLMLIWPPISTLLPRIYTDDGWKIVWRLPDNTATTTTVGVAGTLPPAHATALRHQASVQPVSGQTERQDAQHESEPAFTTSQGLRMPDADEPLNESPFSDGALRPAIEAPRSSLRHAQKPAAAAAANPPGPSFGTAGFRASFRRGFSRMGPSEPAILEEGLGPPAMFLGNNDDNIGRLTVGYTRAELAARQDSLMDPGAPLVGTEQNQQEVSTLFTDILQRYNSNAKTQTGQPRRMFSLRAPQDIAAPLNPPKIPQQRDQEATPGRQYTLGPFQLKIMDDIPVITPETAPRTNSRYPSIHPESNAADPVLSPAVEEAVYDFAADCTVLPRAQTAQYLSQPTDYETGGDAFITFGKSQRRVAVPLLQEAFQYAISNAQEERDQAQLFTQCLLGGGVANIKQEAPAEGGAGVKQPLSPLEAAQEIAQAVAKIPTYTGVTVTDDIQKLGIHTVLAVPDFSARRQPPRTIWFPLVFGVLIVGLIVAAIVDAVLG